MVSKYNNKCYFILDICFDMNTDSTFELRHEHEHFEVSFFDYFCKRYGQTITQKKQPMIKACQYDPNRSASGQVPPSVQCCYLVPELCHLVGMTEQMRNKRSVWREIKQVIRVDAPIKIERMKSLIAKIFSVEKKNQTLSTWGLKLKDVPAKHKGYKLDPGNIVMGPKPLTSYD